MPVKLTPARKREVLARIRAFMAADATDDEISKATGLTLGDVRELRRQVIRAETDLLQKRTDAEWFAEYRLKTEAMAGDLDMVIELARKEGTKQMTAVVGAVRAKAQIAKDVIEMGQTLGLISRKAQQHEIIGGIAVANLELSELRELIAQTAMVTARIVDRYEGATILDIDPGPAHRELAPKKTKALPAPAITEDAGAAPKRPPPHNRTRVAKGRRVVRGEARE